MRDPFVIVEPPLRFFRSIREDKETGIDLVTTRPEPVVVDVHATRAEGAR